jgi:hypothetical protein
MSQVSSAVRAFKATGDVNALINTIVTDIEDDFAWLQHIPGISILEQWVLNFIINELSALGASPTLVDFVKTEIANALAPPTKPGA